MAGCRETRLQKRVLVREVLIERAHAHAGRLCEFGLGEPELAEDALYVLLDGAPGDKELPERRRDRELRVAAQVGGGLEAAGNVARRIRRDMAERGRSLDEILDLCHGVMVARGDLGVELPFEEVPLIQKKIVATARRPETLAHVFAVDPSDVPVDEANHRYVGFMVRFRAGSSA